MMTTSPKNGRGIYKKNKMKKYSNEWWQSLPPEKVGKETERLVEGLFAKWNEKQSFAWHRLPDSKSARNFLKAQPADYIYRSGSSAGFLEVKALKHPFRLPAARLSQLPVIKKWNLAGAQNIVLVFHYMENVWRAVLPSQLPFGVPSWDLSGLPTYPTAEDALLSTGYFYEGQ